MIATLFNVFWIVFLGFCVVVLLDFARLAFLRWRWNKRMARLVKDVNWRHWIGTVKTRLESMTHSENVERVISQDAQWFHDLWKKDYSAFAAVEKWLATKS